jgi:hypothetical protein
MTGHPTAAAITRDGKVVEVFCAEFISCPLDDSSYDGQAEGVGIFPRADTLSHPHSKPVQDAIDRDGNVFPHEQGDSQNAQ